MQRLFSLLIFWLCFMPGISYSIPVPDVLLPVGHAKLKVLWFDIYHADLFSNNGTFTEIKGPLYLKLTYQRNIDKDDLLNETKIQLNSLGASEAVERWINQLNLLWPDIKKDDSLSFYLAPSGKGHFYHNGIYIGAMSDPSFGTNFLAIWLGEKSSFPKMTKQLIGGQ